VISGFLRNISKYSVTKIKVKHFFVKIIYYLKVETLNY